MALSNKVHNKAKKIPPHYIYRSKWNESNIKFILKGDQIEDVIFSPKFRHNYSVVIVYDDLLMAMQRINDMLEKWRNDLNITKTNKDEQTQTEEQATQD